MDEIITLTAEQVELQNLKKQSDELITGCKNFDKRITNLEKQTGEIVIRLERLERRTDIPTTTDLNNVEQKIVLAKDIKNMVKQGVQSYAVSVEDLNTLYKKIQNELVKKENVEEKYEVLTNAFNGLVCEFEEWKQKYFIDDKPSTRTHLASAKS